MRTYQTLSLIGCIFGILLTIGLFITESALVGLAGNIAQDDTFGSPQQQQRQTEFEESISPFLGGLALSFLLYIVALSITFAIKDKTKLIGILLIVIGLITTAATNGWGIISFALLLPAGIVALRYKKKKHQPIKQEQAEDEEE